MHIQDKLTKQERKILELVAKGWRNSKIGTELFISPKTVATHLYRIYGKLGVSSRTEAAIHFWSGAIYANPKILKSSYDSLGRKG